MQSPDAILLLFLNECSAAECPGNLILLRRKVSEKSRMKCDSVEFDQGEKEQATGNVGKGENSSEKDVKG